MTKSANSKITRSIGIAPGIPWAGPLPGGGYDGRTKHLDRAVMRFAKWLQAHVGGAVQVRFNSHRLSGGAYTGPGAGPKAHGPIAIDRPEIGLSARLAIPKAMWERPEWTWTDAELEALPLHYHILVYPQFLRNPRDLGERKPDDDYGYWTVTTSQEAYRLLRQLLRWPIKG
jgi:hypothetical protein